MTAILAVAIVLAATTACAASDVAVRFVEPHRQQPPPADLPPDARSSGTVPDPQPGRRAGGIEMRIVRDVSDRGPLSRVISSRLQGLEVTWWDGGLFRGERAVADFLSRLVGSNRGSTVGFVPWAQQLPVPSVAMTVEETRGRRGRLLVWYGWPSVYTAYQDGDGTWWFSYWMEVDELRVQPRP
jgi:hypothetical protein